MSAQAATLDELHIWNGGTTADDARKWTGHHLAESRARVAELLAVEGARTVENTLEAFDRAQWHLRMAGSQTGVMFMVHPAAEVRDAAQGLAQEISAEGVALSLDRDVYRALAAVDVSAEDEATKYHMERVLLGYKLAGADRDDATREKVRELADRMTELSMAFSRTVQDDVRKIAVEDPNELIGLPQDYLTRHGVRAVAVSDLLVADEAVMLTTDPPDMSPVMNYAASAKLRRRMYLAYNDRGYPANKQVLHDLLSLRQEMARLLGFRSWADLATVDQMMGSAANMRSFLKEVEAAARETAAHEFAELEAFVAVHNREALPLTLSDARFWEEQYRREKYDFDSQSVRPYFPYEQVEAGILATAGKLFGVRFDYAPDAPVWDASVKAFDVVDALGNDGVVGRIYLDMHPREGKSKWFSECSLVSGLRGRQRWAGQSGIATEGDFVEVPSQMLEEFFEDAELLRTFAKHYQNGEPIPVETVARMTRAAAHGRALSTLTQVMYATYSMETHDRRAEALDLDALLREGYDRFSSYEFVDENRMYAAFTHLVGYTSNYYTYLYDKVMALEFFAEFARSGEKTSLGGETAMRYRRQVLEPGGTRPARELVEAFLGREVSMEALRRWIAQSVASVSYTHLRAHETGR